MRPPSLDPRFRRRIIRVGALLTLVILIGTVGFVVLEGYSIFEAFYMTLITITTVGYQELHPLHTAGRVFNSVLILFGVSVMFVAVGAVTQTVIELELQDRLGKRRTQKMIDKMHDHYIVCGFGRVGRSASFELKQEGVPFVVVDRSEERVERAMKMGMLAALSDATRDETLYAAGVDRAKGLIAALASDADNLFVILSARTLNPKLRLVTRAAEEDAEQKLRRAGADTVFAPYSMTGHRLAQAMIRPHVAQFVDFATTSIGLNVAIEQVQVAPHTEFAQKTLRQLQLRRELGVIVLAIRKADGQMQFNPPAETEICAGDFLIAMGQQDNLKTLDRLLTGPSL